MSETRWVSLAQLHQETGLAIRTLQNIRDQEPGVLITRVEGKATEYAQPVCAIALRKREVAKALAVIEVNARDAAKDRRELAAAEREEIALARDRAEAVSVADMEDAMGRMLDLVRVRVLAAPAKIAPLVATGDDVARLRDALAGHMKKLLRELQEDDTDILAPGVAA